MSRGGIPRHDNGLINFAKLARFYPPSNIGIPFGMRSDGVWKNHHAYFKYEDWSDPHITPEDRSPLQQLRIDFRSLRHNRLMLLNDDEEELHRKYATVDPEGLDRETIEASIRDFQTLDLLRHAAAGVITSTINLGHLSYLRSDLLEIDLNERLDFFTIRRDEAVQKLKDPEVTPDDVVASLIGRMAQARHYPFLYEVAIERMILRQRLGKKPNFYPFDSLSLEEAAAGAKSLLRRAFAEEIGIVEVEDKFLLPRYDWSRHPAATAAAA